MSRITAPTTRLAQTSASFLRTGAGLSPKYAELLRGRRLPANDSSDHRSITTGQNPNRVPLSTGPSSMASSPIDAAIMPNLFSTSTSSSFSSSFSPAALAIPSAILPQTPLYSSALTTRQPAPAATIPTQGRHILAADPSAVVPASMLTCVTQLDGGRGHTITEVGEGARAAAHGGGVFGSFWNGLQEALQPQTVPSV